MHCTDHPLMFLLQLLEEVKGCLDFLEFAYGVFGFTFQLELSTVHSFSSHIGRRVEFLVIRLSSSKLNFKLDQEVMR